MVVLSRCGSLQDTVRDTYDRAAPWYGVWAGLFETRVKRRCLEWIGDARAVLDVGVGTGDLFVDVVRRNPGGRHAGVDLSPAMLARARRRAGGEVELALAEAGDLPFPDARFDVVASTFVLELVSRERYAAVLAEWRRVLVPGGRLVAAGVVERPGWARAMCRRHPAWQGGLDEPLLEGTLAALGFTVVAREEIAQRGVPAVALAATRSAP
jgi:phosphatidylethanolamine/phosphatidyl-N-methylethanolamine N-methyltransferase